jgi:hypothetical protein
MDISEQTVHAVGVLEEQDLECGVCFNLLVEPICIPCGHTFCRLCLEQAFAVKRTCPFCRSPCHIDAANAIPNALVTKIIEKAFPDLAAKRQLEFKRERSQKTQNFPIFTSLTLNFPGHILNLHIFEMR